AIEHGAWIDVNAATVPLADYATRWLRERALLRPRTSELYEGLLRLHILPTLGPVTLANLKPPMIRTWQAGLLSGPRPGATTAAKTYRLLRTILATAVDDDVLEKALRMMKERARVRRPTLDEIVHAVLERRIRFGE
ncbi:MAG: N-terminal phage integrase SAM-like domain-containing protein, partial [Acidimicrobiia bacterium]